MCSEEQKNKNMQLNRIISSILFFAVLFIAGCSPDPKPNGDQVDNYYFVKVGNVALPVRVCGNINSDIAIVFVHGGPGGSAAVPVALHKQNAEMYIGKKLRNIIK